jgi:hypothetical protein
MVMVVAKKAARDEFTDWRDFANEESIVSMSFIYIVMINGLIRTVELFR